MYKRYLVTGINIRSAVRADLASMLYVEQQAQRLFPLGDLPASSTDPAPHAAYLASIHDSLCWVAESAAGETIGFIACARIGNFLHILEMDVLPDLGRQGVGSALLAHACAMATSLEKLVGVTLTTFRHLPWNQPFYEKHGFKPLMRAIDIRHIADFLCNEKQAGLSNRIGMLKRTKEPDEPTQ